MNCELFTAQELSTRLIRPSNVAARTGADDEPPSHPEASQPDLQPTARLGDSAGRPRSRQVCVSAGASESAVGALLLLLARGDAAGDAADGVSAGVPAAAQAAGGLRQRGGHGGHAACVGLVGGGQQERAARRRVNRHPRRRQRCRDAIGARGIGSDAGRVSAARCHGRPHRHVRRDRQIGHHAAGDINCYCDE